MILYKTAKGYVHPVIGPGASPVAFTISPRFNALYLPDGPLTSSEIQGITEKVNSGEKVLIWGEHQSSAQLLNFMRLSPRFVTRLTLCGIIREDDPWDENLFAAQVEEEQPTSLAIMNMHYMEERDAKAERFYDLSQRSKSFINYLESYYETPVVLVGVGDRILDRGMDL